MTASGMEYPGIVGINRTHYDLTEELYGMPAPVVLESVVVHEVGHQWFYNIVGSDEYREMFVDEGMNSYWLLRYMESVYGENAAVLELPAFLKNV
jgi:aminopeptidase N